jgi:hypothetical protein
MEKCQIKVRCPSCNKTTTLEADNSYRPFCSARCKLIDLGCWANEDYKIPVTEQESSEDEIGEEDGGD